jgi:tetratricopeptide (TPR) repeat protein
VSDPVRALAARATDALRRGDRDAIRAELERALANVGASSATLHTIVQLADNISEIDIAIEAARRLALTGSIEALTSYWSLLIAYGRGPDAESEMRQQPTSVVKHPSTLYLMGKIAAEWGRFEEAEILLREALAAAPTMAAAWISIASIKRFKSDDPDIHTMQQLVARLSPDASATLHYALGKAWEDCGDFVRAFAAYSAGSAIRRRQAGFDVARFRSAANAAIEGYTPQNLARLGEPIFHDERALFVTGLPRSGTTLVEQVLRTHTAVVDGAECNLFSAAVLRTRGLRYDDALAYQSSRQVDPWGTIVRDYARLLEMRFAEPGRVVDKSLSQSLLIGLLLHSMPDARIAWLRRDPADVAISSFATQFDSGLGWSWSLEDIADYMRAEDRLFSHWRRVFPERILEVPYEQFVAAPDIWAVNLQRHFKLEIETGIERRVRGGKSIDTASLSQARQPISTKFVGRAGRFGRQMRPFTDRYYS